MCGLFFGLPCHFLTIILPQHSDNRRAYYNPMANYTQIYSTNDQAGAAQIEQMRSLEDIDVDRLVWDVEYRESIKESLRGSAPSGL